MLTSLGNCLFNALSDQIYGHQGEHSQLREATVKELRLHSEHYKKFFSIEPRRNPRRRVKDAGNPVCHKSPSTHELDNAYEIHLERMAEDGTWADNMELQAFAEARQTNVTVYQGNEAFVVTPRENQGSEKPTVYIAYVCCSCISIYEKLLTFQKHLWQHYSSIRNIDGPHSGPPELNIKQLSAQDIAEQYDSSSSSSLSRSSTSFTERGLSSGDETGSRKRHSDDEEPGRAAKKQKSCSPHVLASVEKPDHMKQHAPSRLSKSVTASPSNVTNTSSAQSVLPVRVQRLRLNVKPASKASSSEPDDDYVPDACADDDENDAASEYSSGTSRAASSARSSPSGSRSLSKGVASRVQKKPTSSKRPKKALSRKTSPKTSVDKIEAFTSQSTSINGSSGKAKASRSGKGKAKVV